MSNSLRGIDSYRAYYDLDDSLEQFGPERYAYDEDGYIKSKSTAEGTTTYDYGSLGELKEVVLPNGDIITYRHNANNQRVAKLKNNQVVEKYLWLNLTTLLAVYDKDDKLLQRFEYADGRMPLSFTDSSGDIFYLSYNQIGSPRAVTDEDGNILKTLTYDSFGTIIADSNPAFKIPFGFAGGLYDSDTKLTRFGYRDYDASTGKWTAKDPIGFDGGDSNLYGYVLGDPVNFVDPRGLHGEKNPIDAIKSLWHQKTKIVNDAWNGVKGGAKGFDQLMFKKTNDPYLKFFQYKMMTNNKLEMFSSQPNPVNEFAEEVLDFDMEQWEEDFIDDLLDELELYDDNNSDKVCY